MENRAQGMAPQGAEVSMLAPEIVRRIRDLRAWDGARSGSRGRQAWRGGPSDGICATALAPKTSGVRGRGRWTRSAVRWRAGDDQPAPGLVVAPSTPLGCGKATTFSSARATAAVRITFVAGFAAASDHGRPARPAVRNGIATALSCSDYAWCPDTGRIQHRPLRRDCCMSR
jgi:hypothetical protein